MSVTVPERTSENRKCQKGRKGFPPGTERKSAGFSEKLYRDSFARYPADYICQDQYGKALYGAVTAFPELLQKYGYFGVKLLAEGRVRYFANLQEWYRYIEKNVDFMFGTRIHGNLISLLAGNPRVCIFIKATMICVCGNWPNFMRCR